MGKDKRNRQQSAKKREKISLREMIDNQDRLSVIISVQQDEKTIKKVLRQVERLAPKEILVLVHGSSDRSVDLLFHPSTYGHTCYIYPFSLGEEGWRPIGAVEATGDVWLFLSGNAVIAAEELLPFVRACYQGVDIALRKESPVTTYGTVTLAKMYINSLLYQEQLGYSSMSELPLAMTRKAAASIGLDHLLVPPLAQMIAIEKGLRVEAVHRMRERTSANQRWTMRGNKKKELTRLGDYMEAMAYWNELHSHDL